VCVSVPLRNRASRTAAIVDDRQVVVDKLLAHPRVAQLAAAGMPPLREVAHAIIDSSSDVLDSAAAISAGVNAVAGVRAAYWYEPLRELVLKRFGADLVPFVFFHVNSSDGTLMDKNAPNYSSSTQSC
jgi:hypothetical protein